MSRSKQELATEFALRLGVIMDIYSEVLQKIVDRAKIRPDRLKLLMLVRSQPSAEMAFGEFQKKTGLTNYQITRAAEWLVKNRLATVQIDPDDKRRRILKALPSGLKTAGDVAQRIAIEILGSGYERTRVERICKNMEAVNDGLIGWGPSLWPELLDLSGKRRPKRVTKRT